MISNILHYIKAIIIFLPFILFQFFNKRANLKKENRHKQYIMPVVSVAYFIILFVFINSIFSLCESLGSLLDSVLSEPESNSILSVLKDFFAGMGEFIVFMAFNIIALMIYTFIKKITLLFFKKNFDPDSFGGKIAGLFYEYDEADNNWYLKQSYGQVRTFLKTAYYVGYILTVISLFIIANTIRATMYSRRFEISIMKSVGATNMFVRIPFLIEGMVIGLISACVATAGISLLYEGVAQAITKSMPIDYIPLADVVLFVSIAFAIAGVLVGFFGSFISIRKYLIKEGNEILGS